MGQPDPVQELERQLELGSLFAHAALSQQAGRVHEGEALANGLAALLVQKGVVSADELQTAIESARGQIPNGQLDVALRFDETGAETVTAPVDCEARLPICKAVCCRLHFPLSAEEVENGPLKWELGRPYFNRHGPDGYCQQCDPETHACGIYEQRPAPCRQYSCAGDPRIWSDFDAMELNHEWIDEHLGRGASRAAILMKAHDHRSASG